MQDRPTMTELLSAVQTFLTDEVVPALEGRRRFHARVAANVLAIVARELAGEEAALAAEWQGLGRVLGPAAEVPSGRAALRAAVHARTAELCERIRRGDADAGPLAVAVRVHVRATVHDKLRVANPDYLARGR